MRDCNGCTICCEWPRGEVYGHVFYMGKPCNFLGDGKCTIYEIRPEAPCRTFYCAWAQDLLPTWMKPNECGVLVSVENKDNKQFLRVTTYDRDIDAGVLTMLERFSKEHKCEIIYKDKVIYGGD